MNSLSQIRPGTKVLFGNFPADGHFNPLTGLAVHLKNLGCEVRWYTSVKYEAKIRSLSIPFYPLKKALDINSDPDPDKVFPDRKNHKGQLAKLKFDFINLFILRAPEFYADVQEIYKEFPFEIMVADICFGAIPFVKEKMNIPVITASIVPLCETSRDLPPGGLGKTPSYSVIGKLRQSMMRFISDKVIFAHPRKVFADILAAHGIDAGNHNLFDLLIQKSSVVLQSGTPGFEYRRSDMSGHIHFAGPLLPFTSKKQGEPWFHEKLRQYSRIVLITQGTVERDVEKLIVPTLEALKGTDFLVIVTTGGSGTGELRTRFPQDNILIEDFIPFDDVMPYADVYVTNGGYGGVLLSIGHGLPMVVAGVHEGKNEINARVGYFKLGINLKTEKPTPAQIKKSVETVISDPAFRMNVKKLAKEFKTYDPGAICARHLASLLNQQARVVKNNVSPVEPALN